MFVRHSLCFLLTASVCNPRLTVYSHGRSVKALFEIDKGHQNGVISDLMELAGLCTTHCSTFDAV